MRCRPRQAAFTLIEVMVSIAVFALMSALAYGALNGTIDSAGTLGERMERLQGIQKTMRYLDEDFMQLAPRPVRKDLGDAYSPALESNALSGAALELTRAGWSNPAARPRGTLQRVAYRIEDEELLRYYWNVLDRTYSNEPVEVVLIDGVESLQIRYLLASGDWVDEWPPQTFGSVPDPRQRPRAVEVVLTLLNEGVITRLVEVAP